ncbi:MAG: hypothetical protein NWE89_14680 [Candidatus Bathyarchaeota archaeon]|nr:hypothetical protein [Candidatus Bathyarchaeota archaeon]
MSKHFTVDGGNLYIFATGGDLVTNLDMFPSGLNLFEAEQAWRISPWVAVVEDVLRSQVEKAQIILQLNGYVKTDAPSEALESYFRAGDEQQLLEVILEHEIEAPELVTRVRDD